MSTAAAHAGRIGPNAITRVAEVLLSHVGDTATRSIFERAGLLAYLAQPPEQMVAETEVTRLHGAMRDAVGWPRSRQISRDAGLRTGDYLLAHRIPKAVQVVLRVLPAPLAARLLLAAIRRHAWTFAGSGHFRAQAGRPVTLSIRGNPLCRGVTLVEPGCDFYAATFERLFRALVHGNARVAETRCEACGDEQCLFEVRW